MTDLIPCPGCGDLYPPSDGATHAYIGAAAGCWGTYTEVLAREYQDMRFMRVHQQTVDAYAVQHPGVQERRTTQSVAVHLLSIYALLELGYSPGDLTRVRQQTAKGSVTFHWLTPPADMGKITIRDLLAATDPDDYANLAATYVRQMWRVWEPHHPQIRDWATSLDIT